MDIYLILLILVFLILISSLISIKLGVSVTIIEIIVGIMAGNLGIIQIQPWMLIVASFAGVLITFLAGTETDIDLMRDKFKESFLIGIASFGFPFIIVFLITYFLIGWTLFSSLIVAIALSETSIAVVYAVLIENNLFEIEVGKILMVATFITNLCTVVTLSIIFLEINLFTIIFYLVSIIILVLAYFYGDLIFSNEKIKDKLSEVEIKSIFLILLIFIFLANAGRGQAILPAFLLGLLVSKHLKSEDVNIKPRLQTVAFALINPLFFIVAGMKISIPLIVGAIVIFLIIFVARMASKIVGVYTVTNSYYPEHKEFITLMMSTGLTFGLVVALFGLNHGLINQTCYSLVTGILVLSAIIPSFFAEKYFNPKI